MVPAAEPRQQAPNSKLQAPKKHQVPNTKHQAPNTREVPSSKLEARAAVWSLELGISLVFGVWCLVFRFRNFSGAWGLVLGVSLHFSHHFDRTIRHGVKEGLAVAFGQDAVVEHDDDAAVGLRAKQ